MAELKYKEAKDPCIDCKQAFQVIVQRGRPATRCEDCRIKKQAEQAKDVEINIDNIFQGDPKLLLGDRALLRPAVNSAEAQCPKCGRLFTSDSACEAHKDYRTTQVCRDPATLGMVPRERRGLPVWTRPSGLGIGNGDDNV